mmetsp:Transcript_15562/g.38383  ORF Transcript_15562/g.38383 Transcript_15562/m.38383 type:complete len:205 (-) Transcript_15562:1784-2398(-)
MPQGVAIHPCSEAVIEEDRKVCLWRLYCNASHNRPSNDGVGRRGGWFGTQRRRGNGDHVNGCRVFPFVPPPVCTEIVEDAVGVEVTLVVKVGQMSLGSIGDDAPMSPFRATLLLLLKILRSSRIDGPIQFKAGDWEEPVVVRILPSDNHTKIPVCFRSSTHLPRGRRADAQFQFSIPFMSSYKVPDFPVDGTLEVPVPQAFRVP